MISVHFKKLAQMVDIADSPLQAQVAVFSGPHQKIYNDSYQFIHMLISSFHNAEIKWTDGYILFRKYYFFIQPFSLQSITLFQSHPILRAFLLKKYILQFSFHFHVLFSICYAILTILTDSFLSDMFLVVEPSLSVNLYFLEFNH